MEQGPHHTRFLGHWHPYVQARLPFGGDPVGGERLDQPPAALAVGDRGLLDQRPRPGVGPQPHHDRLQHVADPAWAALLPAPDSRNRLLVPGQDGEAQVRAEGLGDRAGGGPAPTTGEQGLRRAARDRAEVVVLDDQQPRVGGEDLAQSLGALGVQRRSRRVLPAGRQDHGLRATRDRGCEAFRQHPAAIDRDRLEVQPLGPQQVEQVRVAGVLDGDPVTGTEVRLQHPLDPVHRAADDAELPGGHPVLEQLGTGEVDQAGQLGELTVEVDG